MFCAVGELTPYTVQTASKLSVGLFLITQVEKLPVVV